MATILFSDKIYTIIKLIRIISKLTKSCQMEIIKDDYIFLSKGYIHRLFKGRAK